jgi:Protein of unknown function (DUF2845)
MKTLPVAIVAVFALQCASPVRAGDEVRCGSSIISKEVSVEDLLQKCGEPTSKKVLEEDVRAANASGGSRKVGTTVTETWVYDRGSQAFDMVVTIVDGKIKSIVSKP